MMQCKLGDRLKLDGKPCTIRFIGKILQWKSHTAYGLEWDDPTRGKNDGAVDGVRYFKTRMPYAASFVKEAKLHKYYGNRRSFYRACIEIYEGDTEDIGNIFLGKKKVEAYGFESLTTRSKGCPDLTVLTLSDNDIFTAGPVDKLKEFNREYRELVQLDISNNLLTKFEDILTIISNMKNLQILNVSSNRFQEVNHTNGTQFTNIEELKMSYCGLSVKSLKSLFKIFPNLKKMELCGNCFESLTNVDIPLSIKEINLGENRLVEIPSVIAQSNVESLLLPKNCIASFPSEHFKNIKTLDLSFNLITNWSFVSRIDTFFPYLTDLRINHNPFLSNDVEDSYFLLIVAQIRDVKILNGTILPKGMREEAERYFLSQVSAKTFEYDKTSDRWKSLIKRYGIPQEQTNIETHTRNLEILQLKVTFGNCDVPDISILSSCTVRFLRSVISRLLNLSIFEVNLTYLVVANTPQEFNREFSPLNDFDIKTGDTIVVKKSRLH